MEHDKELLLKTNKQTNKKEPPYDPAILLLNVYQRQN